MKFEIVYTARARRELRNIQTYIEHVLLEPATAKKVLNRILDRIDSLDEMPMRFRLYDGEPWHSRGLRVLPVDKYLVFYLPNEEEMTVEIVHVLYGGMDINKQLE
ncbi:MAG: type II toxin-antitoxin system RelE/ParE family toxin [Ruminococcus sp.]|nr:type II toxin-antitoxin system RelE/ParE family toxin [Ruminococcus sp.]